MSTELFEVFVFGTLKEGFPNFYLNQGKKQKGSFMTQQPYLFYLVGERHSPCVIEPTDNINGACIKGELYQVNKDQLAILDKLERTHEANGYTRTLINIINEQSNEISQAFIYLKSAKQIDHKNIKLGPINCYLEEHTKLYQYRILMNQLD